MEFSSSAERVCYVHCTFCNTILAPIVVECLVCDKSIRLSPCLKCMTCTYDEMKIAQDLLLHEVSVPCCSMYNMVTVRCGHCANLLSVNIGISPPTMPHQDNYQLLRQHYNYQDMSKESSTTTGGSSSSSTITTIASDDHDIQQTRPPPIRPPEKRQRVPSAYNKFIKEEIQRIKASNPEISHREAFSAAAKNWAHFPHIHFGLNLDGQSQARLDQPLSGDNGATKSHGFY